MQMTLRALRANKNMTQAEAAKAIGVSKQAWRNYEMGKTYPNVPVIKKIEKEFNTSFSQIFFTI